MTFASTYVALSKLWNSYYIPYNHYRDILLFPFLCWRCWATEGHSDLSRVTLEGSAGGLAPLLYPKVQWCFLYTIFPSSYCSIFLLSFHRKLWKCVTSTFIVLTCLLPFLLTFTKWSFGPILSLTSLFSGSSKPSTLSNSVAAHGSQNLTRVGGILLGHWEFLTLRILHPLGFTAALPLFPLLAPPDPYFKW